MLKKTALNEEHKKLGGKMVDFGGWELPVQYSGLASEHQAVRNQCGIFDVSHMGEILIEGSGALEFVNYVTTNDASVLAIGQAQYSVFCNDVGGIVDDLVVYRLGTERFFLVVNASNTDKDFAHIQSALNRFSGSKPTVKNQSNEFSQIAIQGPLAERILQKLTSTPLSEIRTYWCREGSISGSPSIIAQPDTPERMVLKFICLGVTLPKSGMRFSRLENLKAFCHADSERETPLRLEMKYSLYGHELNDQTNPLDVGLGWVTKLNKASDFIGRTKIMELKASGLKKSLVGLKSLGRGIPRQGYEVYSMDPQKKIGEITSGTSSPSLKYPIGVAFIDKTFETIGTRLWVKIREELQECEVVKTPFFKRESK